MFQNMSFMLVMFADPSEHSKINMFTGPIHTPRSLLSIRILRLTFDRHVNQVIGPRHSFLCCGAAYNALSSSYYELAQLRINRRGKLVFTGAFDFASGFDITLEYSPKLSVTSNEIGLTVETYLTPRLASFLALNERTIQARLPLFFSELRRYRRMLVAEFMAKGSTLSYEFLDYAYEHPTSPSSLLKIVQELEVDTTGKVMQMFRSAHKNGSLTSVDERLRNVTRSPAIAWWYLFWVSGCAFKSMTNLTRFLG
jgi:hypothetical protein